MRHISFVTSCFQLLGYIGCLHIFVKGRLKFCATTSHGHFVVFALACTAAGGDVLTQPQHASPDWLHLQQSVRQPQRPSL
jgi:hypothetical protein